MAISATQLAADLKAELDVQLGASSGAQNTARTQLATAIANQVAAKHNADLVAGGLSFVDEEVPAGTVNGSNAVFTLANVPTPASSLHLFLNGVRLRQGTDYTLTGQAITYVAAQIPQTGDTHHADYRF